MSIDLQSPHRPSALRLVLQLALIVALVIGAALAFRHFWGPRARFQKLLDLEVQALNDGDRIAYMDLQDQADLDWWEMQGASFDMRQAAHRRGEAWAQESQPRYQVTDASMDRDLGWAIWEDPETGGLRQRVEFFRLVESDWLHTAPNPAFWGELRTAEGERLRWVYRERDEAWVGKLVSRADVLFDQIRSDFELPPPTRPLTVEVEYGYGSSGDQFTETGVLYLSSPLLLGHDQSDMERALCTTLTYGLAAEATGGSPSGLPLGQTTLLWSIVRWETEQMAGEAPDDQQAVLADAVAVGRVTGLQQLWPVGERATAQLVAESGLRSALSDKLIEYIVESYGRDRLPALLRGLPAAETPGALLQQVLGPDLDLAAFEAGWLAYVREHVSDVTP